MRSDGYERECPRCRTPFEARTDRGVCPSCGLFSRVNDEGTPVGVICTYDTIELDDWPYEPVDENFALVLQGLADGGGPLFVSERHEGFPKLPLVHEQLMKRFVGIRGSIELHVPAATFHETPECDVTHFSSEYRNAQRILALTWKDGGRRCDLVACFTTDGGSLDVLLDGDVFWHSPTA